MNNYFTCLKSITLLLGFLILTKSFAQNIQDNPFFPNCGNEYFTNKNAEYNKLSNQFENGLRNHVLSSDDDNDHTLYTIPVVFHIIHNNGSENITQGQAEKAISDLNKAFSGSSPYAGSNIEIQFCLAKQDPNNQSSTGLNRIQSTLTNMDMNSQDLSVKNLSRWDPKKYINIWVVNEICNGGTCSVAAYAYLAGAHGLNIDGIVCEARWIGTTEDYSKVLAHEVGHYFNLYHTFNQGCTNNDCTMDGDKICDTPPDNSTYPIYPCTAFANSCNTDSDDQSINNPFRPIPNGGIGDQHDLIENYMDYGNLQCQNSFTAGQRTRMRNSLLLIRNSLLQSNGCVPPCNVSINAEFSSSPSYNVGQSISIINTSSNFTTSLWEINNIAVASTTNLNYTFPTSGIFKVRLTVKNGANCISYIDKQIIVNCSVNAKFSNTKTSILLGTTISFIDESTNSSSIKWYIDGVLSSQNSSFTYNFNTTGRHAVMLIAGNNLCSDTLIQSINVQDNCPKSLAYMNNWYFGHGAGLSFASGSPVALTNGQIYQREGCASISDSDGNLLFYTDGVTVYNKYHVIMNNGTGLYGNYSSTQSAIIVPMPGSSTKYYIVTCDYGSGSNGINYSVVDMSLSSGAGAIVTNQKNIPIYSNGNGTAEKIIATKHSDNINYWLVYHETGNANFRTHLINSSGIQAAIISTIGTTIVNANWETVGYLKFSPDSKTLVNPIGGPSKKVELFNFDTNTGLLSNAKVINLKAPYTFCYGIEFSPDGKLLYVSTLNRTLTGLNSTGSVLQYNLGLSDYATISNNPVVLASSSATSFGALQLGPDGRIYCSKEGSYDVQTYALDIIETPNALGVSCQYKLNSFSLGGKGTLIGLPTFINPGFLTTPPISFDATISCSSLDVKFTPNIPNEINYTWSWDFGDGSVSDLYNPKHTFENVNIFDVSLKLSSACFPDKTYSKQIVLSDIIKPEIPDTFICNNNPILIKSTLSNVTFKWSTNSIDNKITINNAGKYWLDVTTANNCIITDTFLIKNIPLVTPFNIKDTILCQGNTYNVSIQTTNNDINLLWPDGTKENSYTAYYSGKHWLKKSNQCNSITDTFSVTFNPVSIISFSGLDSVYCLGVNTQTILTPSINGGTFIGDGIINNNFNSSNLNIGLYTISYIYTNTNNCITKSNQAFKVVQNDITPIINKESVCNYSFPKTITTSISGKNYKWNTTETNNNISINTIGDYWVDIILSNNCIIRDSFNISLVNDINLSIHDSTICSSDTLKLNLPTSYTYTWKPSSIIHTPRNYEITASNQCYTKTYNLTLTNFPTPNFNFETHVFCAGDSIVNLSANPLGGYYTGLGVVNKYNFNPILTEIGHQILYYHYQDQFSCSYVKAYPIEINNNCLDIPNLITPNGDAKNDLFFIKGLSPGYTLEVVNRWGQQVYLNHNYNNSWNASNVSDGVYYYYLFYNNKPELNYKSWLQITR